MFIEFKVTLTCVVLTVIFGFLFKIYETAKENKHPKWGGYDDDWLRIFKYLTGLSIFTGIFFCAIGLIKLIWGLTWGF